MVMVHPTQLTWTQSLLSIRNIQHAHVVPSRSLLILLPPGLEVMYKDKWIEMYFARNYAECWVSLVQVNISELLEFPII